MNTAEAPKKQRQSNLELLRIVSMVFVMVAHVNMYALPYPSAQDIAVSPVLGFSRFLVHSLVAVCDNAFILISGWFGIRPKARRFTEFLFQIVFISLVLVFPFGNFKGWGPGHWVMTLGGFQYWYIKAYIVLYVFVPVLNAFKESASRKQYAGMLAAFYAVQTLYGWFLGDGAGFSRGFSPLSLIGLYLLGGYIRQYVPWQKWKTGTYTLGYLAGAVLSTLFAFIPAKAGLNWYNIVYANSSPIVLFTSVCFFLAFATLKMKSVPWINTMAGSALAIYLVHYHECLLHPYFMDPARKWFLEESLGVFLLRTGAMLAGYVVFSFLLDRVRILAWKGILLLAENKSRPAKA